MLWEKISHLGRDVQNKSVSMLLLSAHFLLKKKEGLGFRFFFSPQKTNTLSFGDNHL
jgi:hypothetical protein